MNEIWVSDFKQSMNEIWVSDLNNQWMRFEFQTINEWDLSFDFNNQWMRFKF